MVHSEPALAGRLLELNTGRRIDVVFNPVGGELFHEALRCLRADGQIAVMGFASGSVPQILANIVFVKNTDVLGFNFGHYL